MPGRLYTLIRRSQSRHFLGLSLLLLIISLFTLTYARPASGNPAASRPAWQGENPWCFSQMEDRERQVGYFLNHPESMTAEEILDAYDMPESWKDKLEFLVCYEDWQDALQLMTETTGIPRIPARDSAEFNEILRQRAGLPWTVWLRTLEAPSTDSTLRLDEVWCYTFFQEGNTDQGVFLGHFPGLTPEKVLENHASTLDLTKDWTERGSNCFATWRLARSFAYYLTEDEVPLYGQSEMYLAQSVIEIYGTPWPAHSLLAPSRTSALLDPDAKPVWCHLVFTGGEGSTVTFSHYPDRTTEEVLEFYKPPDWIRELAAQETTECYTSWEAAFRIRPFEWKKAMLRSLPDKPSEADYEVIMLKGAFSGQWKEYQRPEFSAAGTPDPLMLTRIVPTPTITPTPTATFTPDPRTISRDSAVWCFTHVEDRSHRVVFYMGHPPEMSNSDLRQVYKLPPGLLSQPDREIFCYETWPEAVHFAKYTLSSDAIGQSGYRPFRTYSNEDIQQFQEALREGLGKLAVISIGLGNSRLEASYSRQPEPVWCYSYFRKDATGSGIYLGHYLDEGDEAILTDYGEDTAWQRVENTTRCFDSWEETAEFHQMLTGETVDYRGYIYTSEDDYARILISTRAVIPYSDAPIFADTPTPTIAPTATRLPSASGLLDPSVTDPVWCYTIFTGGGGSTASFGHYPDMTIDQVFDTFNAPDWVKDLAGQQETNCYPTWAAAFEGMWPLGLKVGMSAYLPDTPREADYEMVILWAYFKERWQDYQRTEFSTGGIPQPIILTRMAPTPTMTPTRSASATPVWCFSLFYGDTPEIWDVLIGHRPGMDDADITAAQHLKEDFLSQRPERKTVCFYTYTEAAEFRKNLTKGSLDLIRVEKTETANQEQLEKRYGQLAFEGILAEKREYVWQMFDEMLASQNATLPESDPNALLLDPEHPPVWCATYFRQGYKVTILGHYPDLDVEAIKEIYYPDGFLADATVDKRLCYNSWEDAANARYILNNHPTEMEMNEGDYEILVLQFSFTNLWSTYQRPEFSASVTPQYYQTPTPVATPSAGELASSTLLDTTNLARWCRTNFAHKYGKLMTVGHYPDMDIVTFLEGIEADQVYDTNCYTSWQAAARAMDTRDYRQLNIPQSSDGQSTEKDFEFALLHYHFDQWMGLFQRPEFSADTALESVTPVSFDDVVWCNYFLADENPAGGRANLITLDDYPDRRVDEILEASGSSQPWVINQEVLITIFCYDSWEKLLKYAFGQDVDAFRRDLPDPLNEGDYEILFLWFRYRDDWKDYQRPEFSASEAPHQAVIDFVDDLVERTD